MNRELKKLAQQVEKQPELAELAIQQAFDDGVIEGKKNQRTLTQNSSMHVLFKQVSDQCLEKGVEMRDIVRDEIPIECTPENIKWLWKRVQKGLFRKKSTAELKKTGEIDTVYDNFNKLIAERTKGEIEVPPFPAKKQDDTKPKYPGPAEEVTGF